jgi:hypothetical protein
VMIGIYLWDKNVANEVLRISIYIYIIITSRDPVQSTAVLPGSGTVTDVLFIMGLYFSRWSTVDETR